MNPKLKEDTTVPIDETMDAHLTGAEMSGSSRATIIPEIIMTAIKACAAPLAILPR
jgi:hypothetical protein